MTNGPSWKLRKFNYWLDRWEADEDPSPDLGFIVAEWVMTRMIDPFGGAEPDPDQPDLWFVRIPDSGDGCGNLVCCSYWIDRTTRTVTCNILNSLPYP